MTPKLVYRLEETVGEVFPFLGKWQLRGLLISVLAVMSNRQCQIGVLAEDLPEFGSPNTVKKRLKRWLCNPRIDTLALCYGWMRWVFANCKTERPILLVDETKLGARLGVMMVSLAYQQRAIPLIWRCYYGNSAVDYPQQGQVLMIYGLLAHVCSCLPPQMRPLVQMDRGLGHSAAMLKALADLEVDFLVRVKSDAYFTTCDGHCQRLKQMITQGQSVAAAGTLFKKRPVTGYIRLIWEVDQAEPWCLFTNVSWLSGRAYAMRWWQEESFKDLKSGGWQWHNSQIRCPQRMARLILVMAVAYGWTLSLGTQLQAASPEQQRRVATRSELRAFSVFRLGLRWFRYLLHCKPAKLRFQLLLKPCPLPLRE